MGQGPCAHLQLHETLIVVLDRLNVISSGCVVYMKINAKVCFQGDHLAAIFEVQSGRNVDCTYYTFE
jgi:hypothetical protein